MLQSVGVVIFTVNLKKKKEKKRRGNENQGKKET